MSRQEVLRRRLPWLLCAVSLAMLALSGWLQWRFPEANQVAAPVSALQLVIEALGIAGIPVVGALIAVRLPANPYGWLWLATGLVYGFGPAAGMLVRVSEGPLWVAWILEGWGFVSLIALLMFVFLLFPTGRLPTFRWRWVARAAVATALLLALVVPFIPDPDDATTAAPWAAEGAAGRTLESAAIAGVYVLFGLVFVAMASLVLRFRRAGPVERRQLTWFLYATVVNAVILVLDVIVGVLPHDLITTVISAAGFALLPVAVGIAVLRYRLYEIDRIVSRTVSYALLSAALVGLYLLAVALLQPLLEPITGGSALAVAASTLAVAAVFNPARHRLQSAVDRRFDRARYDAARAVDAFAARLRNEVDLDEIVAGLRDTVTATIAPGRMSVWLRPGKG